MQTQLEKLNNYIKNVLDIVEGDSRYILSSGVKNDLSKAIKAKIDNGPIPDYPTILGKKIAEDLSQKTLSKSPGLSVAGVWEALKGKNGKTVITRKSFVPYNKISQKETIAEINELLSGKKSIGGAAKKANESALPKKSSAERGYDQMLGDIDANIDKVLIVRDIAIERSKEASKERNALENAGVKQEPHKGTAKTLETTLSDPIHRHNIQYQTTIILTGFTSTLVT